MLGYTVIVTRDRARTNIGAGTDGCVADIAKMIGLGAGLDHCLLDLDEIADVNLFLQACAGAQPGVRSNHRRLAHVRPLEVRKGADHGIVLDHHPRSEDNKWLHDHVASEPSIRRQENRFRRHQCHAPVQRRLAQALLEHGTGLGELGIGIDPAHIVLLSFDHGCLASHRPRDGHGIGEVIFAFAVIVADPLQDRQRGRTGECHQTAVTQSDRAFGWARIRFLTDGNEFAAFEHEATVPRGILRAKAKHHECRPVGESLANARERLRPNERCVAEND